MQLCDVWTEIIDYVGLNGYAACIWDGNGCPFGPEWLNQSPDHFQHTSMFLWSHKISLVIP